MCKSLQRSETRILLAVFDLREIAAINTKHFRHFDLGAAALAPQTADTIPETYTNTPFR